MSKPLSYMRKQQIKNARQLSNFYNKIIEKDLKKKTKLEAEIALLKARLEQKDEEIATLQEELEDAL